jgi:hypothetical protein
VNSSAASRAAALVVTAVATSVVGTTTLMVDDIFLIHERLAPGVGLEEEVLFVGYALFIALWSARHRHQLVDTAWPILALGLVFFAAALARNRVVGMPRRVLPDTFAFVAAGLWLTFHVHTTISWVDRLIFPATGARSPT